MNLIVLLLIAMVFAGALFALSAGLNRPGGFTDRDADGEPDDPDRTDA